MTTETLSLSFPDGPRSELDRNLSELVENAQKVLATQGRLRSLLRASQAVVEELDLATVLHRIITAAVDLVGARYGAIGVISPDGTLEQFIHVGLPDELVAQIGHLPEGHGLLGALIDEQIPIRLEHLREDPRSSGFPTGHPPMESFLGVPVQVRGEVYGNLYMSEQRDGSFTAEDQELLVALAATAGVAIDNARLFDETIRRQRWAAASAEISSALLSGEGEDSLTILADRVAQLAEADLVSVLVPVDDTGFLVEVARGALADRFRGVTFAMAETLPGRAYESRQPILSEADVRRSVDSDVTFGPTMVVPLTSARGPTGVLSVARMPGGARFTNADLEMAADFAAQATVALELARGRFDRQRLAMLEDRSRIARDLHDNVIQRLFGAGLGLQALAGTISDQAVRSKLTAEITTLDAAIVDIRTAIFTMTTEVDVDSPSLRHRLIDLLGETAQLFDEAPRLSFSGPIDLLVPPEMVEDLIAVVREALSNVARHAQARSTAVTASVVDDVVTIEIIDDGIGVGTSKSDRRSGTKNLEERARAWGGTFELRPGETNGSVLTWTAPLQSRSEAR